MTAVLERPVVRHHFEPRGAAKVMMTARDGEVLMAGPAGTGKSRACLEKLHFMCLLNGGMRALILRKTQRSLSSTGLVTFREKVAKEGIQHRVLRWFGGSTQEAAGYKYANGSFVAVGGLDDPLKIMSSEYDCVVGDTLVDSPSEIQRAYGRPFSGQLVTITTAAGHQLTGTPNHPVLAAQGWVGLGSLREGDYVVSRRLGQQETAGADPDVADRPTPIAEVARALALANPGCSERVVTVPMDFHGDGAHGYVDVVTTARLFQRSGRAALLDPAPQGSGARGHLQQAALVGQRAGVELVGAGLTPGVARSLLAAESPHAFPVGVGVDPAFADAGVGLGEAALPLAVGVADVAQRLPFGWGAPGDAASGHLPLESRDADVDGRGDGQESPFSGEVALDRIVKISVADAGPGRHVYNLQTGDHWYFANGIVSHNCIYIQEATEVTEDDWESCTSRLRNGVVSFQQLLADCNPAHEKHWLNQRSQRGQTRMLHSRHEDNPQYFDLIVEPDGRERHEITGAGRAYIEGVLDKLTGVRYLRLRKGIWAAAEGVVYEDYDPAIHLIPLPSFPPETRLCSAGLPWDWPRYWVIDFGYTNPFVLQRWAEDGDGRLYRYAEIYRTGRLVEDHARDVMAQVTREGRAEDGQAGRRVWTEPEPEAVICDHDAEGRATFEEHTGLPTRAADKTVAEGIQDVQVRWRVADDGKPRMFLIRDARTSIDQSLVDRALPTCTEDEIPGYAWPQDVAPDKREHPVKENDHGCDCVRYLVRHRDRGQSEWFRWVA